MILISYEYLPVQQGTNLCNRVKVMSRSRRGNGNSGEAALAKLSQGVVAGLTRLVEDNADTVAAMLQAGECNDLELVQVCVLNAGTVVGGSCACFVEAGGTAWEMCSVPCCVYTSVYPRNLQYPSLHC